MGSTGFRLDVVGIGALNLDYISSASSGPQAGANDSLRRRITAIASTAAPSFQWGTETFVDERTVYAALEEAGPASVVVAPCGSAWNAIFALAKVAIGLRLGYVGVAGRMRVPGISSLQQLELLGIDRTFVRRSERRDCGICFSYVDGGERTLLTAPGANVELAEVIDQEFEHLARYLAETRVVHVTSLLDAETPRRLLALLQYVKRINRSTLVSFDPGHAWACEQTAEVRGILALSDFLLVNSGEFAALAGDRLQLELGASLGMRLARHKLRHVGSTGHAAFPEITRELIRSHAVNGQGTRLPRGVFISHGGSPQWHEVRDFIEREGEGRSPRLVAGSRPAGGRAGWRTVQRGGQGGGVDVAAGEDDACAAGADRAGAQGGQGQGGGRLDELLGPGPRQG